MSLSCGCGGWRLLLRGRGAALWRGAVRARGAERDLGSRFARRAERGCGGGEKAHSGLLRDGGLEGGAAAVAGLGSRLSGRAYEGSDSAAGAKADA